MRYENVMPARFLRRLNRFACEVSLGGETVLCHIKNTGRLTELLLPGAEAYVQRAKNPGRKTAYDLITVRQGNRLVNVDSNAANAVFHEFLSRRSAVARIRPEVAFGGSRLDFFYEEAGRETYAEVKGVTLDKGGIAMFPDAPTERGVRHMGELVRCVEEGYRALAVFVVQKPGVRAFTPNENMDSAFARAVREAAARGVAVRCFGCRVGTDSLEIDAPIPVYMNRDAIP